MLLQIREFLRREKIASNQQLARMFHVDLNALEPMLEVWLRKGTLAYVPESIRVSCSRQCTSSHCQAQSIIYYRYVE